MCTVTHYHKVQAANDLSHVVARFLPKEVADLLLFYIAYIRRFTNMIYHRVSGVTNSHDGDYVFSDEASPERCW
jgi:hypothetical protein